MSTALFFKATTEYKPSTSLVFRNVHSMRGQKSNINKMRREYLEFVKEECLTYSKSYTIFPLLDYVDTGSNTIDMVVMMLITDELFDFNNKAYNDLVCKIMDKLFHHIIVYKDNNDFDEIISNIEPLSRFKMISISKIWEYLDHYPTHEINDILSTYMGISVDMLQSPYVEFYQTTDSNMISCLDNCMLFEYPSLIKDTKLFHKHPQKSYVPCYMNYIVVSDTEETIISILVSSLSANGRLRSSIKMKIDNPNYCRLIKMRDKGYFNQMDGQTVHISFDSYSRLLENEYIGVAREIEMLVNLYPKVLFIVSIPPAGNNDYLNEMLSLLDSSCLFRLIQQTVFVHKDQCVDLGLAYLQEVYSNNIGNPFLCVDDFADAIKEYIKVCNRDEYYTNEIYGVINRIIASYRYKNNDKAGYKIVNRIGSTTKRKLLSEDMKSDSYSSTKQKLDDLIGLSDVKSLVKKIITHYAMMETYAKNGISLDTMSRHMVFTGSPGTAKSTVARLMFEELRKRGVVEDKFVEVGRADLVAEYVGQTAVKIRSVFNKANGGILFIDEAYSLISDQGRGFDSEAISTIVQEMENRRDKLIVIFAGYKKEMTKFINTNPGLKSRIAFTLDFPDYSKDELIEILKLMVKRNSLSITKPVIDYIKSEMDKIKLQPENGNGRFMRNILEAAILNHSTRLDEMDSEKLTKRIVSNLSKEDFKGVIEASATKTDNHRKIGFGN